MKFAGKCLMCPPSVLNCTSAWIYKKITLQRCIQYRSKFVAEVQLYKSDLCGSMKQDVTRDNIRKFGYAMSALFITVFSIKVYFLLNVHLGTVDGDKFTNPLKVPILDLLSSYTIVQL